MVRENDFIAIFHSIHRVMKAEKILKGSDLEVQLIPAPRQIGSDCGLALRYLPEDADRAMQLLLAGELPPAEIYQFLDGKFVPREIFP